MMAYPGWRRAQSWSEAVKQIILQISHEKLIECGELSKV